MIPYPIEEMRKFILKEYPNLNNMLHPDYKAGALMSAILRWWTDEQQPEIENLRKQIAALQEIAKGERAGFLHYRASCYDPGRRCPYAKGCDDCTGWDTCSALDRFNADAIRQLSEEHPEAFR